jgi:hypothetical protein
MLHFAAREPLRDCDGQETECASQVLPDPVARLL